MQDISDIEAIDRVLDGAITGQMQSVSTASYPAVDDDSESFDARLLRALATMAVRSKRRQADLSAALRRGGLTSESAQISTALRALELAGFIEHIVPLYDGGMLMSVTSRGIEQLHVMPRWARFDTGTVRV